HAVPAPEQRVQEPVRDRGRTPPHQRGRYVTHGRELGHLRARRRGGPRLRAARVHAGHDLHRAGDEVARPRTSGLAAESGTRRPPPPAPPPPPPDPPPQP